MSFFNTGLIKRLCKNIESFWHLPQSQCFFVCVQHPMCCLHPFLFSHFEQVFSNKVPSFLEITVMTTSAYYMHSIDFILCFVWYCICLKVIGRLQDLYFLVGVPSWISVSQILPKWANEKCLVSFHKGKANVTIRYTFTSHLNSNSINIEL